MEMEMEAGGPSSKRRSVSPGEDEDGGGVDRISALPDALLGEIISLLPTKDGARTRILAPRWRHLWLSAPLNLDSRRLVKRQTDLAAVVSHILSSHQGPGRRFCIPYPERGSGYGTATTVDNWLRSPALDNLQELDVSYGPHHPLSASTFRFSTTLRVFTIGGCVLSDSIVQALHFPLLKHLGIDNVSISECSLHSMIASCPVLECLFIKRAVGFNCIRINSPVIKSIGICVCGTDEPESTDEIQLKDIIIESAPCLERLLNFGWNDGLHISLVSAPKLETLGFLSEVMSVNGVDFSTRLVFGSTVIQGLRVHRLAMVVCTVKTLALYMKALNLDIVIELMRCFPCLEKLYIKRWCGSTGEKEKNFWRRKHRKLIPSLDIHLKTIVVYSTDEEFIEKQQKKLQLDNRASRGAQFHFTTDSCRRGYGNLDDGHVHDLDLADPFIYRC
ncbi:unnamed protein product [Alopecurus aequalis]